MIEVMLLVLLVLSILVGGYLGYENKHLKKKNDYYIELDEENQRLKKELGTHQ